MMTKVTREALIETKNNLEKKVSAIARTANKLKSRAKKEYLALKRTDQTILGVSGVVSTRAQIDLLTRIFGKL